MKMDNTIESGISNISIIDLSKEDLQKEYSYLKGILTTCQTELDDKKQQNYNLQRELARKSSLEHDYIQEIEVLQTKERVEVKKLNGKIHEQQQMMILAQEHNRERVFELEQLVLRKDDEVGRLNALLSARESCVIKEVDYDRLFAENDRVKREFEVLAEITRELEINKDAMSSNMQDLRMDLDEKNVHLKSLQENYNLKKQELAETNGLVETLQEEMMLMRIELESLKNKPLDTDARGNSLFAEVNDRRVQLQKNMGIMKAQYVEMKQERSGLLNQISALKRENTYLTKQWTEDVAQRENDDRRELNALKNRIATLTNVNQQYENLLKENPKLKTQDPSDEMQFMKNMMNRRDRDLKEALKRQNEQSQVQVSLSRDLYNINQEKREWKSKALHLEAELSQLRTDMQITHETTKAKDAAAVIQKPMKKQVFSSLIQNYNKTQSKEEAKKPVEIDFDMLLRRANNKPASKEPAPIIPECVEISKAVDDDSGENKENTKIKKRVKFTEDTKEINESNSARPKRPGRITPVLTCPLVIISNSPTHKL